MITLKSDTVHLLEAISHTILEHSVVYGVALWRLGMKHHRACDRECSFGLGKSNTNCAHCLEGGLRTVNLYQQVPPEADCRFLKAANALRTWNAPPLGAKLH